MLQVLPARWQMHRGSCFSPLWVGPISSADLRHSPLTFFVSSLSPSPFLLASHFFAVIFYAIWVVFTHPRMVQSRFGREDLKPAYEIPSPEEYPLLMLKGIRMVSLTDSYFKHGR